MKSKKSLCVCLGWMKRMIECENCSDFVADEDICYCDLCDEWLCSYCYEYYHSYCSFIKDDADEED